jgi:cytochrome c-type biogenesis protein
MAASTLSIGLAFLGGVLTVLSPCVLPILPILVGRSLQSHIYGPVALLSGLISGFAVAGSLLGITTSWFTGLANGLRYGAVTLLFILGLLALFPGWSYRLFGYLPLSKWIKEPPTVSCCSESVVC